jgi:curved DNA-binding protein CbpA
MARQTYYDILGVPPHAAPCEIKAAYRERIFKAHPDRNRSRNATKETARLNEAWNVLKDRDRRCRYDSKLSYEAANAEAAKATAPPPSADTRPPSSPPPFKRKPTPKPSDKLPWACPNCDRDVPRSMDRCMCGQTRPAPGAERSSPPPDTSSYQASQQPPEVVAFAQHMARYAAGYCWLALWLFRYLVPDR